MEKIQNKREKKKNKFIYMFTHLPVQIETGQKGQMYQNVSKCFFKTVPIVIMSKNCLKFLNILFLFYYFLIGSKLVQGVIMSKSCSKLLNILHDFFLLFKVNSYCVKIGQK